MATQSDINGSLTAFSLVPAVNLLVAAGTQTYAGVDLQDYINNVKLIFTHAGAAADGSNSLQVSILDSADNTTFAATAGLPTFAAITADSGTVSVALDTRNCRRYIQGKLLTSSTTATFRSALIGVGLKQVV
jgi:hypothetical protein